MFLKKIRERDLPNNHSPDTTTTTTTATPSKYSFRGWWRFSGWMSSRYHYNYNYHHHNNTRFVLLLFLVIVMIIVIASLFVLSSSLQQQPMPIIVTPKITTVTSSNKIIMTKNNNNSKNHNHNIEHTTTGSTNTPSPTTTTTTTANRVIPQLDIPFTMQYHQPPTNHNNNNNNNNNIEDDDYYSTNPTVFGDILRGTSRARILDETNDLLAFVDRTPQSTTLHALIIPKRYIPTIRELQLPSSSSSDNNPSSDLQLLYDMEQLGQTLVQRYQCSNPPDHRMVFHIPPYNTVDHLHLHVLCNHDLSIFGRTVKYVYDTPWCISLSTLLQQQQSQQKK